MKPFKFSRLYPRGWREAFGDEFDAVVEASTPGPLGIADIFLHAAIAHGRILLPKSIWILPVGTIAWLNIFANEVQWPAMGLVATCFLATVLEPRRWLRVAIGMALVIPLSSLWTYQNPGVHHEPIYKTAVALLPALFGSICGRVFDACRPGRLA